MGGMEALAGENPGLMYGLYLGSGVGGKAWGEVAGGVGEP